MEVLSFLKSCWGKRFDRESRFDPVEQICDDLAGDRTSRHSDMAVPECESEAGMPWCHTNDRQTIWS
jgi:hypothetical protein